MKLSVISSGTDSRIAAKFQTDRFRAFGENRAEEKKLRRSSKPQTLAATATLRSAVAGGVNNAR